tara:strand:- start:3179 stop:3760 length:582 start_codon:yes stop_codon:yes gene_type:complete
MSQFDDAITKIDAANSRDPNSEEFEGESYPKELLYGQRMSAWMEKVAPEADEPLKIAARAQHIQRWELPRTDYDEGKKGYHLWRTTLYRIHAEKAAAIMADCGYGDDEIEKTRQLLLRRKLRSDPQAQILEDVICLVFLENYFLDFSRKHDEAKMIGIIQKTWAKMTPRGHEIALTLDLSEEELALINKALAD